MLVALLLLAAPGAFDSVFDPGSDAQVGARKQAFEAAVAKRGLGAAIKAFRGFEEAAEELAGRVSADYERYRKASDAYWAYRKKTGAVAEAVPAKLNKPFLDLELVWKGSANRMRRLRTVQDWAVERVHELVKAAEGGPDGKTRAALVAGLKDRNAHQRYRCARLLASVGARRELEVRARSEKHPGVLAVLYEAIGGGVGLNHAAWAARAGAARGLKDDTLRQARLAVEKGRLREDLGEPAGPTVCFGVKSSSRRLVLVYDHAVFAEHIVAAINTLPDDALYSVVLCGGEVVAYRKKLSAGGHAAAIAWVQKMKTDGRSDVFSGVRMALDMGPDTVFLATARGPGGSEFETKVMYPEPLQVCAELLAYNRLLGVRIHAAGPSSGRNGNWLQKLTAQFGGQFRGP